MRLYIKHLVTVWGNKYYVCSSCTVKIDRVKYGACYNRGTIHKYENREPCLNWRLHRIFTYQ